MTTISYLFTKINHDNTHKIEAKLSIAYINPKSYLKKGRSAHRTKRRSGTLDFVDTALYPEAQDHTPKSLMKGHIRDDGDTKDLRRLSQGSAINMAGIISAMNAKLDEDSILDLIICDDEPNEKLAESHG